MGTLGYAPCIYDRDYPCSFGCSSRGCRYYTEDEDIDEEEDDDEAEEDDG